MTAHTTTATTHGDAELDVFHCPLDGIRLIEASAGTGKTWAICALVLRLLLERGLAVQQVLVVTFTEAATAELRERIRGRIAEVLAALQPGAPRPSDPFVTGLLGRLRHRPDHDDEALRHRLAEALHAFDEAAIHTIHGYCQRALADAPFSAGLPMAMEVIQDDAGLRDAAVREAWRDTISRQPLPEPLAALLLRRKDSPEAWSLLLRRLLGRPLAQRRWPAAIDGLDTLPVIDTGALAQAHAALARHWATHRQAIVDHLKRAIPVSLNGRTYTPTGVDTGAAGWDAWLGSGDPLAPLGKDERAKAELFRSSKLAASTKGGQPAPVHPFFDEAEALFTRRTEADAQLALARAWLMRRVLEDAEAALRRHKQTEGLVAFDDMLFNLHQRLHDPAAPQRGLALAAALRARFPAALIDEFQDTDPLQFAIFRRLYGPAARADSEHPTTLFLVGDPKQAIYSFRNADLPTYLAARALADSTYRLGHNQRSVPALVHGLNRLYAAQPRPFLQDGLAYHAVAVGPKRRSVLVDHSHPDAPAAHAALQLWTIPPDPSDGLPPLRAEAHGLALDATAAEIARLLGEARHARITLDGRPLRAGDIAVLVRSHRQGGEVRQALAARGIGSVELSQASVYRSPDAEELAWVLTAVLQPGRERLLRAALATELFGRPARMLDAAAHDPDGLMPEMLRFADYATTWRERGIAVMLRRMMAGEQIAARLLRHPQGERRLTNWLHLGECLHEAEATHRAPAALLRWFERQRSDEAVTEQSQLRLESDQNLVQIVTVHKSKGLEYPFVFCPFLWAPSPAVLGGNELMAYQDTGDAGPTMVIDFRGGLDEACDTKALRQRIALDAVAEDLRLAYVALTRAVHRCMLVVGCSARATARGGRSPTAGTQTPLNWLVAGGGIEPADWLSTKTARITPAEVAAAWRHLAAPSAGDPPGPPAVGCRDLAAVAAAAPVPAPTAEHAPPALQALPPPARLPAGWAIGSYSQLSRGRPLDADPGADIDATRQEAPDLAAVDHDALAEDIESADDADDHDDPDAEAGAFADPAVATRVPGTREVRHTWAADDILRFPRGAAAGDCIHQLFERTDFRTPSGWPAAAEAALDGLPPTDAPTRAARAAMLQSLLRDVGLTPLNPVAQAGAAPFRLADIDPQRQCHELEFHLEAPALSAAALNTGLARLGYPVPPLAFGRLHGYLRGFIDLVFEHGGRHYVLDWKSNHLGGDRASYTPAACARAMAAHGYHLQALVYALALDRLLRLRRADYRHADHFGGVIYLFVRGVRPGWTDAAGQPCGVVFDRPGPAVLDRLDGLFRGHGPASMDGEDR